MALFDYLKSTLLSKVVMAVTGVILVLFLIGHCVGNMQMFIGRETFNAYAHFLQGLGELLWVIRIVLFLALVLHIITSIRLTFLNMAAKPVKYEVKRYVRAKLTGRTMIWTGLLVVAFLVLHLGHFTTGHFDTENFSKNNLEYYEKEAVVAEIREVDDVTGKEAVHETCKDKIMKGEVAAEDCKDMIHYEGHAYKKDNNLVLFARPDAYAMVIKGFRQPVFAIAYIVLVIIVGFHLSHAIQSAFQTLGLNHPKYDNCLRKIGPVLSTILVLCYISIPITIYLGLVGGCV